MGRESFFRAGLEEPTYLLSVFDRAHMTPGLRFGTSSLRITSPANRLPKGWDGIRLEDLQVDCISWSYPGSVGS